MRTDWVEVGGNLCHMSIACGDHRISEQVPLQGPWLGLWRQANCNYVAETITDHEFRFMEYVGGFLDQCAANDTQYSSLGVDLGHNGC